MNQNENENEQNPSRPEGEPEQPQPIGRRRFIKHAAALAFGGAVSLTGLVACGEEASTPLALNPTATSLATSTTAPATATPTSPDTILPATATNVPATAVVPTTAPATAVPTATAAPSPTPVFKPIRFGVLGDIRTAGPKPPQVAYGIIEKMKAEQPDGVVLVGDIINAETSAGAVREQWNNIKLAIADLAPGVIMPTVGNHETNGLKSVLPYFVEAFPALPANGPDGYKGMTYSYDIGSVHFVSITSEHPDRFHFLGEAQMTWLDKDLAANRQPFTFVFSHDPAFPVGPHVGSSLDAYPKDRDLLWKTMQKYKVTAYICGHEHLYNRSEKNGLTHLVIGTSGSAIYGGYGGEFYHYALFNVTQSGVAVKVMDSQGKLRDSFTLS